MHLPERVPSLSGRWLGAYRAVWWAMLALALIGLAGLAADQRNDTRLDRAIYSYGIRGLFTSGVGFRWTRVSDHPALAAVPERAELLAIDGESVPARLDVGSRGGRQRFSEYVGDRLKGPSGRPRTFTFRDSAGDVSNVVIVSDPAYLALSDARTGIPFEARVIARVITGWAFVLLSLTLAILLFARRAREPVAAMLALGLLFPAASNVFALLPDASWTASLQSMTASIPSTVILLALLIFPNGSLRPWWTWLGVLVLAVFNTPRLFSRAHPTAVLTVLLAMFMAITMSAIWWRYRRLEPAERQQIKWAVFGIGGFFLFQLLNLVLETIVPNLRDPAWQGVVFFLINLTFLLGVLSMFSGLTFALLRYRLYDADAALGTSAMVAGMMASLLLVFTVGEKFLENVGKDFFGGEFGAAPGMIAAALAALSAGPLHKRINRWAERRFQGEVVRLRTELPPLADDLRETETPERLAGVMLDRIARAIPDTAMVIRREGETVRVLAERGAAGSYPTVIELGGDGVEDLIRLDVGTRPDGRRIGKDERAALTAIADPLGRALAVSLKREREIRARDDVMTGLSERLSAVEATIAGLSKRKPKPA